MKNVLVTGCGGFLGSMLTQELLARGYSVVGLDNLYRGSADFLVHLFDKYPKKFKFVFGSINNEMLIEKVFKDNDFDYVAHMAALVGEPVCKREPDLANIVNVEGTRVLVNKMPDKCKIFYSSTGSCYGNIGNYCSEEITPNPISIYAVTKLNAENLVLSKPNSFVYRFSTAYGNSGNMRVNLLINNLVYDAIHKGNLVIYQADFKRSFVHVLDIIDSIIFGFESELKYSLYNVGDSNGNMTKREVAEHIKEKTGCATFYADEGYIDPDQRNYFVNFDRITGEGWTPKINLIDGINQLIDSAKLINIRHQYQ